VIKSIAIQNQNMLKIHENICKLYRCARLNGEIIVHFENPDLAPRIKNLHPDKACYNYKEQIILYLHDIGKPELIELIDEVDVKEFAQAVYTKFGGEKKHLHDGTLRNVNSVQKVFRGEIV